MWIDTKLHTLFSALGNIQLRSFKFAVRACSDNVEVGIAPFGPIFWKSNGGEGDRREWREEGGKKERMLN